MQAVAKTIGVNSGLNLLIDAIGSRHFEGRLASFLSGSFYVDHFTVFGLDGAAPTELAAVSVDGTNTAHKQASLYLASELWRRDPTMIVARETENLDRPNMMFLDVGALEDRELREVVYPRVGERLLVCGKSIVGRIGLSLLRTSGHAAPALSTSVELHEVGGILLSILSKHLSSRRRADSFRSAFISLDEIAARISSSGVYFPSRELQVCSRLLYGISTIGIALDLSIGEETVITYRKRIYNRLEIGTQRELMIWYLSLLHNDYDDIDSEWRTLMIQ